MYKRDESKMHTASALVILLNAVAWPVLGLGLIFSFFTSYHVAGYIILAFVAFWYVFSEKYFNYQEGVQIDFKDGGFNYEYRLNSDIVGSGKKVTISAKDITKIKVKEKKAVVWGSIVKKAPYKKSKVLVRIEIMINFGEDREELVTKLLELERRGTRG